ncbi:MAG: DUF3330 domain-containing protein [Gammaproteobacteria bacterium]|nr:DUF3330 domain-containing protein [Gammaproteobacteria bacterium]MCW8923979.1 DUF3330 domain-containing protein [Gammaproteobacteria bacterium]
MNDHNKSTEIENIPCEICLQEIPQSEAKIIEVDDYVVNFCGLECYEKWRAEEPEKK